MHCAYSRSERDTARAPDCRLRTRASKTHRNADPSACAVTPWQNKCFALTALAGDQETRRRPDAGANYNIIPVMLVRLHAGQANEARGKHSRHADVCALAAIQCCGGGKGSAGMAGGETLPVAAIGAWI